MENAKFPAKCGQQNVSKSCRPDAGASILYSFENTWITLRIICYSFFNEFHFPLITSNEAIQQSGMTSSKNGLEMENHVFQKARNKDEYLGYVARLILHVREMSKWACVRIKCIHFGLLLWDVKCCVHKYILCGNSRL